MILFCIFYLTLLKLAYAWRALVSKKQISYEVTYQCNEYISGDPTSPIPIDYGQPRFLWLSRD